MLNTSIGHSSECRFSHWTHTHEFTFGALRGGVRGYRVGVRNRDGFELWCRDGVRLVLGVGKDPGVGLDLL